MNITILVAGLPPDAIGGAERQAAGLAQQLAPRHAITILTRTRTVPDTLRSLPSVAVVRRSSVTFRGVRFAADLALTVFRIARLRGRTDVIVAYQTVIDGLIGVIAGGLFGIPVIVSVRCDTEYQFERFLQSRLLTPFVLRHADRIAVQSEQLGDEVIDAFMRAGRQSETEALRKKLFVLPNGIAIAAPATHQRHGILYVGRLTRLKGVDILIDAIRRCPRCELTIIGDGPERESLARTAAGIDRVKFAGATTRVGVMDSMARAQLLVLPSRNEGVPNVVMEAMASGLPVIATAVGGVPGLIAHAKTGWLIPPDDVGALVNAIQTLTTDDALRASLAANALREIARYDWPAVLQRFEGELQRTAAKTLEFGAANRR